ncbi:unnamed protein product [Lota lota]
MTSKRHVDLKPNFSIASKEGGRSGGRVETGQGGVWRPMWKKVEVWQDTNTTSHALSLTSLSLSFLLSLPCTHMLPVLIHGHVLQISVVALTTLCSPDKRRQTQTPQNTGSQIPSQNLREVADN